jgi:hypothetical protein
VKRTDVKTGVIYAYKTRGGEAEAGRRMAVLDVETFHAGKGGGFGSRPEAPTFTVPEYRTRKPKPDWKADENWGFLAVVEKRTADWRGRQVAEPITDEALLAVTKADLLAMTQAYSTFSGGIDVPGHPGVQAFLANPRFIVGEYAAAAEGAEAVRQERNRQDAEQIALSRARVAAAQARVDRLKALGLDVPDRTEGKPSRGYGGEWRPVHFDRSLTRSLELSWEQVDALLSLIPEGAVLDATQTDPQVEPDGWTLTTPPYTATEEP